MTSDERISRWLQSGRQLLKEIKHSSPEVQEAVQSLLEQILVKSPPQSPRLYLIVNQGVHPIEQDLKRQFGADIRHEVITRGNVSLNQEKEVAQKVKKIVEANRGAEFVIVPSGIPYLAIVVYNTVYQVTSKHPVYLQLDREKGRYVEKVLDPRKLIL